MNWLDSLSACMTRNSVFRIPSSREASQQMIDLLHQLPLGSRRPPRRCVWLSPKVVCSLSPGPKANRCLLPNLLQERVGRQSCPQRRKANPWSSTWSLTILVPAPRPTPRIRTPIPTSTPSRNPWRREARQVAVNPCWTVLLEVPPPAAPPPTRAPVPVAAMSLKAEEELQQQQRQRQWQQLLQRLIQRR